MDAEDERIWKLFGALSDASWRKGPDPGGNVGGRLMENLIEYHPLSAEERAIWTELTAPHNYGSLCRYMENMKKAGSDLYTSTLHGPIFAEATRRWETEDGIRKPDLDPGDRDR